MRSLLIGLLILLLTNSLVEAGDVPLSPQTETTAQSKSTTREPIAARETGVDFSYSPNWPEPPDTSGMLLRLAFGTVVTLGLCVATLLAGRRWLQRPGDPSSAKKLQIEESVVLGHRATLFLVKVGDTHLVAGTDATGLKSLLVLPTSFTDVLDQQVEATSEVVPPVTAPLAVWKPETRSAA